MLKMFIILIVFLTLPLNSEAVKDFKFENGLKVFIIEDNKSPLATFQIWYKAGSKDEPYGKTGISHLLEHMMFKGSKNFPSKQFSSIIQKNGGVDNAFTTRDYTMYYQTLPSSKIDISFALESDRMVNLLLKNEDIESEKMVVMEERRMRYEDDPQNLLFEEVIATAFKVHSYRWPIIGWMSDIASINKEDLYSYYKSSYCPENSFIIVSGDVSSPAIIPKLREKFGGIPSCDKKDKRRYALPVEPEQKGQKRVYLRKEAELPYVLIAYHVPTFPNEDSYALEVLSAILSGGKSSRLYREIVYEKKFAINVFADYYGLYQHPFLFLFGATASPKMDIDMVEKSIYGEIEKLKIEAPSEKEVQKAKNQIEASFVFAQDSNFSKGLYTGLFELLGDWRLIDKYLEGIRSVTAQDIKRVASKYLIDDRKTVGILIPIEKKKAS